jgi:AcrR family transcriptional regulator
MVAREKFLRQAPKVLARNPSASVADLAAAAGASRASFYRHFRSKHALLEALEVTPEPGTRERILEAAVEMVAERTVSALSMDELAERARVSRATLYRIFPGKASLLAGLIETYSPLEPVAQLLSTRGDERPELLIPELARTAYRATAGHVGLIRVLFTEISSLSPETEEVAARTITRIAGQLVMYLTAQMAAGTLRPAHPLLALQSLVGPVLFHILTRPLAERYLHLDVDGETAVTQLAEAWLRAMTPEEEEAA